MAKFHINPQTGDAGPCNAAKGGCPFGGDEIHFTSLTAAREASEKLLANSYGDGALVKRTLQELNSIAKDTSDPEAIASIIANGSERTLNNLAQNKNLTDEQAKDALEKATTPRVRAMLMSRGPQGNFENMTPADYEEIVFQQAKKGFSSAAARAYVNNPFVSDEAYREAMASSRIKDRDKTPLLAQTLGEDNKITPKFFTSELEKGGWKSYPVSPRNAVKNGKLQEDVLKRAPEEYLDSLASNHLVNLDSDDLDMLTDVATNRGHERLAQSIVRSPNMSALSLSKLANGSSENVAEVIFNHPNASSYTLDAVAANYPDKPFVKVGKLRRSLGDSAIVSLVVSRGGRQLARAYSETTLTFDMAKVKALGLTKEDIYHIGNAKGYNAGVGFDEDSGVLTLRVDTSD